MTLEELRGYRGRDDLIKSIYAEIAWLYSKTSGGSGSGPGSTGPSDPTAAKVARIGALEDKIKDLEDRQRKCESFLDNLQDDELCAIMRYKYIAGWSWNKIANSVGYKMTSDACRKLVKRYFEQIN